MQQQQNSIETAIQKRMVQERMYQKRDELNVHIQDIKTRVINAYREKGEDHRLSKILTSVYVISLKIQEFTEIMIAYNDLMQLVFGTIQDVDMFYEEFMDMMNFSLKNKSTFFSRWKQRRRIKKFKKQMRLKFQDMEVQMQSLTDFADMLGGVMDSLYIGLDKPKKRKKGDPVSIVTDPVVAELRNAAFGNGSGETGSNVGGSSTGGPNDGSTGGNTGSGTGVDTSGLF